MTLRSAVLLVLFAAGCGASPTTVDMGKRDAPLFPEGCSSGDVDGEETDVDCGGGTCGPCVEGKACRKARDCQSGFCTNNLCDPASCMDGVKNGTESDLDCGGTCDGCVVGKACNGGADCASMTCTNGSCVAGVCMNAKQDGDETDVDCGGPVCMACADGKKCAGAADCLGGVCTNEVCKGASNTWLPVGVVTNAPVANLTGWTQCYSDTYAEQGTRLAQIMNVCSKSKLFFACRFAGTQTLIVGAWIERTKVSLIPAIAGAGGSKTSWSFSQRVNGDGCWAVAPEGASLPGGACNLDSNGADRMSWSLYDAQLAPGYRCGLDYNIHSNAYERVIFHAD